MVYNASIHKLAINSLQNWLVELVLMGLAYGTPKDAQSLMIVPQLLANMMLFANQHLKSVQQMEHNALDSNFAVNTFFKSHVSLEPMANVLGLQQQVNVNDS